MSREDYDAIKEKHDLYFKSWQTKDLTVIPEVFSPHVGYFTSTSLFMPDGSQNSLYGVRDFLLDFPETDHTDVTVCNYTCREDGAKAVTYAETVCDCADEDGRYFQFTALVQCEWAKTEAGWKIVWLRQTIVPVKGTMQERFKKVWYLKEQLGRKADIPLNLNFSLWTLDDSDQRGDLIFAEEDSPWLQMEEPAYLTKEEKLTDVIYRYYYGLEHHLFSQSYNCISSAYGICTGHPDGSGRRQKMIDEKEKRLRMKMPVYPIVIDRIEYEQNRAFVYADMIADKAYSADDCRKRSYAKEVYEFVQEDGLWRIVYMESRKGVYQRA